MSIQKSSLWKGFAVAVFLGVLGFAVLVIILHFLRPEMNPIRIAISDYAIGPYGFLMTLAFLLRGLGVASLVAGIASSTGILRSRAGLVLLSLITVGSFLVAIFPADRQNLTALVIHSLSALLNFICLGIAALVWSRRFRTDPGHRDRARTSLILGWLMLLSTVGFWAVLGSWSGLVERILEVFIISWLWFMAWQLYTIEA